MTAGGVELVAEEALAVWSLAQRQHVDVGHWVKMVEVYQSTGSS